MLEVSKKAVYFTNLADHSDASRVEHSFANFAPPSEFGETINERGLPMYDLGTLTKRAMPVGTARLWRVLRREDSDIVHTHLAWPTYVGLTVATMQRSATVLTRHHSDALHVLGNRLKRNFYLGMDRYANRLADHIIAPSKMVHECIVDWEGTAAKRFH